MRALIDALWSAWSVDTEAPGTRVSGSGMPHGQCAVTALVVQDLLGGDLIRAVIDGESHYWNMIPGVGEIDLTRWQFSRRLCPECNGGGFRSEFEPHLPCLCCEGSGITHRTGDIPRGEIVSRSRLLEGDRAKAAETPRRYQLLKQEVLNRMPGDLGS